MASAITHIGFVNDLNKINKTLSSFDINGIYSGALFPDYYGIYKHLYKNDKKINLILKNEKGIEFSKKMYSLSKTKEERSFVIGFLLHSVLDTYFHKYFREAKVTDQEHIILELYYDTFFKGIKIPKIQYPKNLIEKTIKKYYKEQNFKKIKIKKYKLKIYNLILKELQKQIIEKRYINKKKTGVDVFLIVPFVNKIIKPDSKIIAKHYKNLKKEYEASLIEADKLLSQIT